LHYKACRNFILRANTTSKSRIWVQTPCGSTDVLRNFGRHIDSNFKVEG
jgi:hypothetical protein